MTGPPLPRSDACRRQHALLAGTESAPMECLSTASYGGRKARAGSVRTWNSEAETSSQNHSLFITAAPRSGKTATSVPVTPYTTSVDVNSGTACPEERAEMSLVNVCVPDEN
jgi:hypothetical protein